MKTLQLQKHQQQHQKKKEPLFFQRMATEHAKRKNRERKSDEISERT
jgi:hypothetical protein